MKRLSSAAATCALAASLLLTMPAAAGGWAAVNIIPDEAGPKPVAGVAWPVEVQVLQHGVTPIDWEQVSIVGRNPASGLVVAANASASDTVGRYLAEVVFPDAGDWTLELGLGQLAFDPNATTVSVGAPPTGDPGALAAADKNAACSTPLT
jgi:hypothetical protein